MQQLSDPEPIGFVTRNRAVYLDATLRSLSASDLPDDLSVVVFDDASDDAKTRAYLDTDDRFQLLHEWPRSDAWNLLGLGFLPNDPTLRGIASRVEVQAAGPRPMGVVNSSCAAIREMFRRHPNSPGIILLQDDLVLNSNWYERLVTAARRSSTAIQRGLMAGLHFDRYLTSGTFAVGLTEMHYYTAQCYYLTRTMYDRLHSWFQRLNHPLCDFDRRICYLAQSNGFSVELLKPF